MEEYFIIMSDQLNAFRFFMFSEKGVIQMNYFKRKGEDVEE